MKSLCLLVVLAAFLVSCAPAGDTFHIDVKKGPAYVKQGFDAAGIQTVPQADSGEWHILTAEELEHEDIRIKHTGLPIPKRRFLSPRREKDLEYTILLPFRVEALDFSRIMTDKTFIPGMFLAGIGDNWAVYLNGVEVREELHLDAQGGIVSHRSWRDVFFPIDKRLLRQGTNALAFRIIGAPNFKYTGLFYAGEYYIGRYGDIERRANDLAVPVLCSIFIFIGVYHFFIFLGLRKERYYFFFSVLSALVGFYNLLRSNVIYIWIPDTAITVRLEYCVVFMIIPMLCFFVETLAGRRIHKISMAYGIFCAALAASCCVFPLSFASDALSLWQVSALFSLSYVTCYDIIRVSFHDTYQAWKAEKKRPLLSAWGADISRSAMGNILIGGLCLFSISVIDLINSLVFHVSLKLTRYGFLFFALGAAYILIRRYIEMNRGLEATVRQRTAELETQTRLAESASRAKSDFLANMSHEIRTPMNAILGMVELLLRKDIPGDARSDAENIRQAGRNLLAIINDILDFSKIESGRLSLVPVEYSLAEMISGCINIIRVRLAEKDLNFIVNVDPDIPARLFGDEIRIRQIALNLLSNAVKYTPHGRITLNVSGAVEHTRVTLRFDVEDTGIGIKEEDAAKLFQEFNQFDSHRNRGIEGTGLGLAISRNLARLMGGDITMRSRYGEGSVFTAALPQEIRSGEPAGKVENAAGKPVLFFEKDKSAAASISSALQSLRVPYRAAAADETAADILAAEHWAFVIAPAETLAALRPLLREHCPAAQPVLAAGFGEMESPDSALVIHKPLYSLSLADLLNGVSAAPRVKSGPRFTAPSAKILVVDDVITNLKVVYGLLQPYGAQVHICNSGKKALGMAEKVDYDVIFMDHMMPGMDGIETADAIRGIEKKKYPGESDHVSVPIIALTANAMSGMREMFLENGFQDYLMKPIDLGRLDEVMETWIPEDKRV